MSQFVDGNWKIEVFETVKIKNSFFGEVTEVAKGPCQTYNIVVTNDLFDWDGVVGQYSLPSNPFFLIDFSVPAAFHAKSLIGNFVVTGVRQATPGDIVWK